MKSGHKILFFIVLLILLFIICRWYWRLQLMFNSAILSLWTPDSFPVPPKSQPEYQRLMELGERATKTQRIIIATMLRDVAHKLPEIEKRAERIGGLFADYRILIVENDSSDGTRSYLLSWARRNPRVIVLGCGINVPECHMKFAKTEGHMVDRRRIQKMTDLRNIYLDEIKKNYRDWDYVLMWDADAIAMAYLDGIQHSFGYLSEHQDVDVTCANGIYRWGLLTLFYDTYALLDKDEKFHIDMKTPHDIRKGVFEHQHTIGDPMVEVDSCFSGFSIYRLAPLLDPKVRYDMSDETNLECEHVRLNKKIPGKKIINPSMINFILLND